MNAKKNSTSMVLMELIMVTGFFILCAGVCLLVYMRANNLSHLSAYTDQAAMIASNIAEEWKAGDFSDFPADAAESGGDIQLGDGVHICFFDDSNVRCNEAEAVFTGVLTQVSAERYAEADIKVIETKKDRELVEIKTKKMIHR